MIDTEGKAQADLVRVDALANAALSLWPLPADARAKRINVSENVTYLVRSSAGRAVLRVHRVGYHSDRAIECELAWSEALRTQTAIRTPAWRVGRDGAAIQVMAHGDLAPRRMVMFDFAEGDAPREDQDLAPAFHQLGAIAAETHLHSMVWRRPRSFRRFSWDVSAVFGPAPIWGDWRSAPGVDMPVRDLLQWVEAAVTRRLTEFGKAEDRFGLIHADMRLANLILSPEGPVLIDFDDCGFGWFLFDFAAAISFIEDNPQVPALKEAWLAGYQSKRALTAADINMIDTFVMLRRMSLLAWIGSHIEAPEPQALTPDFAANTATLAEAYLSRLT